MQIMAAKTLADSIKNPTPEEIIPDPFTPGISQLIAESVK
jgi:malic enzyme